ncbi:phage major capsid protein [Streptomyces nymphaeiformis]|jgi:HK97 family phage major capsid protein|uniref:HK97 family phage major capsid protein n=1 Tax=Streptomyces nymphaeiformis TaxID=2663842 RepID=A0A7W7U9F5_9ACTN|nr:phage major capsid protein [Streptomyces nymphaeiformis]MBB4987488.1 HK97 family phage major capsid protein [Streptomyces nymphaeiformis]
MANIRELRTKRTKLGADARAIMQTAEAEGRSMTPEEEVRFDKLMDERDGVDRTIARAEKLEEDERDEAALEDLERGGTRGGDEAMGALRAYLLGGRSVLTERQARALNAGHDPEGGFLVAPQQFVQDLLRNVDDMVALRGLATVHQLIQAESLGVPTLDTDLNDADWTSELGTGSQDDSMRFGKRELRPHPLAKRVKVSRKLMRASTTNPETLVRERMAYKFGVTAEKAYMIGDGNQKPLGLFTPNADGIPTTRDVDISTSGTGLVNVAAGNAADDLITAKYALKGAYHRRAQWLFHRLVLASVRKLKDGDGNYIWRAGLADGEPDKILDLPYIMSEFAPSTFGDGDYVGILGDFSYYWIAESLAFEVQRLNELYAETNQVGFIGRQESDGMPVLAEAFVRLQANDVVP